MTECEALYKEAREGKEVRQKLIRLISLLKDEESRRKFMYFLGGNFEALYAFLSNEDPKVRRAAARLLAMTEDEDVVPHILAAWENEKTLFIREDYLKAIKDLDYSPWLPALKKGLAELKKGTENTSTAAGTGVHDIFASPSKNHEKSAASSNTYDASASSNTYDASVSSNTYDNASVSTNMFENAEDLKDADGNATGLSALWDNDRHLQSEILRLKEMIRKYEKHEKHRFKCPDTAPDLILITNRCQTELTASQISTGQVKTGSGTVLVRHGNPEEIFRIRTFQECLFKVPASKPLKGDEKQIAEGIHQLRLPDWLDSLHEKNDEAYRYRIELKSTSISSQKKGSYIRRIASALDLMEKGKLENSESDYEIEIRLIERKDQSFVVLIKLFTIRDERFLYRLESDARSMAPVNAAICIALARPWLKEKAQVLDPFCRTGTLLIERKISLPADPVYGLDKQGEAIQKARINTEKLGILQKEGKLSFEGGNLIHYINRDFFDFSHDYPFDEIITELPHLKDEEASAFIARFLQKAEKVLKKEAVLLLVTDAPGILKEIADREGSQGSFRLEAEFELNERSNVRELIFKYRSYTPE